MDVSISSGMIFIVNTTSGEIREAKLGEFKTYKIYGAQATPVILIQNYLQNVLLVGYEE